MLEFDDVARLRNTLSRCCILPGSRSYPEVTQESGCFRRSACGVCLRSCVLHEDQWLTHRKCQLHTYAPYHELNRCRTEAKAQYPDDLMHSYHTATTLPLRSCELGVRLGPCVKAVFLSSQLSTATQSHLRLCIHVR